jgi:hypothetical protein
MVKYFVDPPGWYQSERKDGRGLSVLRKAWYTKIMDVAIKYAQSAFKHGVTKADIHHAIMNLLYDDCLMTILINTCY